MGHCLLIFFPPPLVSSLPYPMLPTMTSTPDCLTLYRRKSISSGKRSPRPVKTSNKKRRRMTSMECDTIHLTIHMI